MLIAEAVSRPVTQPRACHKRGNALGTNLKGCLLLTLQFLDRICLPVGERQAKDVAASQQQVQGIWNKS